MPTDTATVPQSLFPNTTSLGSVSPANVTKAMNASASAPPPIGGGMINVTTAPKQPQQVASTLPPATGYQPASYQATPDVVGENETVQQQVKKIIDENSPLMQQANRIAREEANSRGLLNSSMAVGAGQQAVISQALPIAQQDANTYAAARASTNQALNRAGEFNAGSENTMHGQVLQANTQLTQSREGNLNQQILQGMSNENQLALANLDVGIKKYLGELDANNRQLLQTNASAATMFQNVVDNISRIAQDPNMSSSAKNAATNSQLNLLNEGLRQISAVTVTDQQALDSLDLSSFFAPGSGAGSTAKPGTTTPTAPAPSSGLIDTGGPVGSLSPQQQQDALAKRQDNANKLLPITLGMSPAEEQFIRQRMEFGKTHQGFETQEEYDNARRQQY